MLPDCCVVIGVEVIADGANEVEDGEGSSIKFGIDTAEGDVAAITGVGDMMGGGTVGGGGDWEALCT